MSENTFLILVSNDSNIILKTLSFWDSLITPKVKLVYIFGLDLMLFRDYTQKGSFGSLDCNYYYWFCDRTSVWFRSRRLSDTAKPRHLTCFLKLTVKGQFAEPQKRTSNRFDLCIFFLLSSSLVQLHSRPTCVKSQMSMSQ